MKRRARIVSLLLLLSLILVMLPLLQPLRASAVSKNQTHSTTTKHAHPLIPANLAYHGGPVMEGTSNAYVIFWEPMGYYVSPTYNKLILRYFKDIGSSKLYQNNTQYPDSNGKAPSNAVLAGSWVDTHNYPSDPLSDAQVQAEVTHAQNVNKWSASLNNAFFVFTAKGENICNSSGCSFQVFCAYHSYFGGNNIYVAMPYTGTNFGSCGVPVSPNNDFDADSTINITSHEQNEVATDPLLNAWFDPNGAEIAELCYFNFGPTKSFGGDVKLNHHPYEVQKEWDNAKSACKLSGP